MILSLREFRMVEDRIQTAVALSVPALSENTLIRTRIPLMQPALDAEMMEAALLALQNEKFVLGESVYRFEEDFARFCGSRYAVSTGSGTAALQIALQALGVGAGDTVLTTPFSFFATANAVIHAGATPDFADVTSGDVNLSPEETLKRMTAGTGAIIPVHLYGRPCQMDEFCDLAEEKGLALVEDACQAHGADYKTRKVGSIGDAGCFSFYPSKNMTVAGDGGMIVTNSQELEEAARSLRDCGRETKYTMSRVGYTSRLNTVNAAIGRVQLRNLEKWNADRRRIAALYRTELEGIPGLTLPPEDRDGTSVYHLFVIRTEARERIKAWLEKNGVETGIHYPVPIHLQAPYKRMSHYSEGMFPESERLAREVLSLPIYPGLTDENVHRVSSLVRRALSVS